MKKKKIKLFLKIFFILLLIQFVIAIADILLHNANSSLSSITSTVISIISLPLSMVNKNLPFYAGEGIIVTLLFWTLNLVIQTLMIFAVFRIMKRLK
ncbi:hypothetical protein [Winogradskyella sp. PG-2]|uniref:hypothetical protein n=1 Tax=Winogradskyella sp. PG-2 TaxID=754409 RepID=UPI00045879CD|nr:hypothetical protein [Winogradskyella sp. PG-2]BAO74384.1 hypothetical protein WPG_0154 [Winogradskyella sp. PG-2]